MDYHAAAKTVSRTVEIGCGKELTDKQFTLMAGALAVMLDKATMMERAACIAIAAKYKHGNGNDRRWKVAAEIMEEIEARSNETS